MAKMEECVHEIPGGWVVAVWDEVRGEWRSIDVCLEWRGWGVRFVWAGSLEALVDRGVRMYPTREVAEAAARDCYYID